jgi:hypothetical protein
MKQDDPLEDFQRREMTLDGVTKAVHVAGAGPAVIVMTEMPGISPHVARFARWVRDAGFTFTCRRCSAAMAPSRARRRARRCFSGPA